MLNYHKMDIHCYKNMIEAIFSSVEIALEDELNHAEVSIQNQFVYTENCSPSPLLSLQELQISETVKTQLQLYPLDHILLNCWGAIQLSKTSNLSFVFDNSNACEFSDIRAAMILFPFIISNLQSNSVIVLPSGDKVYQTLSRLCSTFLSSDNEEVSVLNCLSLDSVLDLTGISKHVSISGCKGKSVSLLNGFSCVILTPSVLLMILKDLKLEMSNILFVEIDRYDDVVKSVVSCINIV
ncbi:hypothetical protein GJ496_004639 [Pomphorhynchus laevis]|nr:hypothetical protein GJ496_004639 [Pomphorhynchus laevis]